MRVLLVALLIKTILIACTTELNDRDWANYLGDTETTQFSDLRMIDTTNVNKLSIAWTYSSNDLDTNNRSQIQCNPLIINGILYGTSPKLKLFALKADSGEELWSFDPFENNFRDFGIGVNRGLVAHDSNQGLKLFFSAGSRLFSIHAETGLPVTSFGENGSISLHKGLEGWSDVYFINSNSPGIIYKDLIIQGSRVSESVGAAPGHIRAFNVHSGELVWTFRTIPHPMDPGYDTWPEDAYLRIGGANAWAGFSLDQARGIVYCPTGSAAYDFFGGDRHGDNLYANSIVALDALSGSKIWHYQFVHHDIWDKDLPAPPVLFELNRNGHDIPAIGQITKNGQLFILNRVTGVPLYPIREMSTPPSFLKGEKASESQPHSTGLPSFSRQEFTLDDLASRSPEVEKYAKKIYQESNHGSMFTPPSVEGTIIFPGFDGGGEWGGPAYDKNNHNIIINSNEVPWLCKMEKTERGGSGKNLYATFCQNCHGHDFAGGQLFGNVPSLVKLKERMTPSMFGSIVVGGKGIMPSFSLLDERQISTLYKFIIGENDINDNDEEVWPYPYRMRGYEKLYAKDGFPIIKPPWGQLTSINTLKGKVNWQIPLGHYEELGEIYKEDTGTENYGGPLVTAGGIIFIAATADEKIRAFKSSNGQLLWEFNLPSAGYATPATYSVNGKQYVVIACGGGKLGTKSGDEYVAFTL